MSIAQSTQSDRVGMELNPAVDVVVVSYNSRETLRGCVEELSRTRGASVFVEDNASGDDSLAVVADLAISASRSAENSGFAAGCNRGWRAGRAPYVLFLNPDARIDAESIRTLVSVAEADPGVGIVAPRLLHGDGALQLSQRSFPSLRSTFAQALFLHRLFPDARWADEVVHASGAYEHESSPDWVSGACLLARRSLLEALAGWDESFFLYSEDTDICRRARDAGYRVAFEPSATATHVGGQSSPRAGLLPLLAASRIRYAKKHENPFRSFLSRIGVALSALTHMVLSSGGLERRAGHARALAVALGRAPRVPYAGASGEGAGASGAGTGAS